MIYLSLQDEILVKAKNKRIARYSRLGTQAILCCGLGYLIVSGTISFVIVGEMIILGGTNKITKMFIKKIKESLNAKKYKNYSYTK